MIGMNSTVLRPVVPPHATHVPMADLRAQFSKIGPEVMAAVQKVMESGAYILGPYVERFEAEFAGYCGTKHCVAVNTGTSALHLALLAAGVKPGDEVITVPMTFIATSWGISYCGATPVYVDVDPATYTMDPAQVEKRITPKSKAILPVHLYGQPADLEPLMEISRKHGIPLIEDCAQAHGATYKGRGVGTFGQSGCFSFYPGKNLGAFGEAGAIVTDDASLAAHMRALRDHAQAKRYHHSEIGFNYRMDGIQGAVLSIKLKHIARWTEQRQALGRRYQQKLDGLSLVLPVSAADRTHVWHLFVVLHADRERIRKELDSRGIQSGLHYPIPLHLQEAYASLGGKVGDFPVSERVGRECLTLPLFAEMTTEQQDAVVDALTEIL